MKISGILILLPLFLCCLPLRAQVKVGLKIGLNYTNVHAKNAYSYDRKSGLQLGLLTTVRLTPRTSFQPELLLMRKGSTITYTDSYATGSVKYKLDYVDVPLLLVIKPLKVINIHFGPYFSYLVNASTKVIADAGNGFDFSTLGTDDFHRTDYGACLGLGLQLTRVLAGVRYNYGLKKIGRVLDVIGNDFAVASGRNSVTSLYLGLYLSKRQELNP